MLLVCLPPGASATVEPPFVTMAWDAAPGPVLGYWVFLAVNDGPEAFHDFVAENRVEIDDSMLSPGDRFEVRVFAVDGLGNVGPPSEASGIYFFGSPPAPQRLQAQDGTLRSGIALSWDPVPDAELYVVVRWTAPGEPDFVGVTGAAEFVDISAEIDLLYSYQVLVVHRRQVGESSAPAMASRSVKAPSLVLSTRLLRYTVSQGGSPWTGRVELTNSGDWPLTYTVEVDVPWLDLGSPSGEESGGTLALETDVLEVSYDLAAVGVGMHTGNLRVQPDHEPFPGDPPTSLAPLDVQVELEVIRTNQPPVLTVDGILGVYEGESVELPISVFDPDGDRVDILGVLPDFVQLVDNHDSTGVLIVSPGYDDSGWHQALVTARDVGLPRGYDGQLVRILVQDSDPSP